MTDTARSQLHEYSSRESAEGGYLFERSSFSRQSRRSFFTTADRAAMQHQRLARFITGRSCVH
jgi:hypothetical protein